MFTRKNVKLFIAGVVIVSPGLRAQVSQTPPVPQTQVTQGQVAQAQTVLSVTLADALARAKTNSPQFQAALTDLGVARENRVQARAALLPSVNYDNSFIYTQGTGTGAARFIANNNVHEYISQGAVHQAMGYDLISEYRRVAAALALSRARAEIAARGLTITVVQDFYGLLSAQEKTLTGQHAYEEGQHFLDISKKLEQGGEVAHSDVIKAQIQANDLKRAYDEAKLAEQTARLTLAVLLFPNFFQDFTLVNDLEVMPALPPMDTVQTLAQKNNPELRAAFSALEVAEREVNVARAGHLPTLSVDFFYGIDANHFAIYSPPDHTRNLGYAGTATLNIPVWNWGATQSKVKQAELQRHQAQVELSAAQRQAVADLQTFYSEAALSREQVEVLKNSATLAAESLRLTYLRYQAGEATALEVVDAQNTLTTARNNYQDGQTRYRVALANLQTLTGTF